MVSKKLSDPSGCDLLAIRWIALRLYLSTEGGGLAEQIEVRSPLSGGQCAVQSNQLDLLTCSPP